MKRLLVGAALAGAIAIAGVLVGAGVLRSQGSGSGVSAGEGEYGTLYIDVKPDASNTTTGFGPIDVCRDTDDLGGSLDVGDSFTVDVVIGGAVDLAGPYWILYYNKDVLKVTGYNWTSWKMGSGGMNFTDAAPDTDGAFATTYAQDTGVNGDGVLLRLTLQAIANGSSDLKLCTADHCPDAADSGGSDRFYPQVLVHDPAGDVRAVVGGSCPASQAGAGGVPEEQGGAQAGATPEVGATPEQAAVPSPVSQGKGDAVDRAKQATEADRAKPRFRGELGDFVIVEPNTATGYPCPEPHQPAANPEQSELYFSLPGAVMDMVGSCQGTIIAITASVPDGVNGAMVGRGYFLGPKLEEPFDAPAERLKLITVGGKPALAELPVPEDMTCTTQVVVIERFPSEAGPGIAVSARTINDLDRAIALAEQIMGVRQ